MHRNPADDTDDTLPQLARPSLRGREDELARLLSAPGPIAVIRARPGYGGTRLLEEIEIALAPARSLYLATAGAEPLGALRRAFGRSVLTGAEAMNRWSDAERHVLWRLLSGEGTELARASELVAAWTARPEGAAGVVLIDDVMEIDDPSLEAVAGALRLNPNLRCFARFEGDAPLPASLETFAVAQEIALEPLSPASAEQLLMSLSSGWRLPEGAGSWAVGGMGIPLGMIEALLESVLPGEIAFEPVAAPPSVGARPRLMPSDWIERRLHRVPLGSRRILEAIAILGLEVSGALLLEIMSAVGARPPSDELFALARSGWLRIQPDGSYVFASRSHREAVLASLGDQERSAWHAAASLAVEKLGGSLAKAEAARHAALSGEQERAVELALAAARLSHSLGLTGATEALLSFADSDASELGPARPVLRIDSWIETLRASGVRDGATGRLEAIARLSEGRTQEALEKLEEGVRTSDKAPPAVRSRAWLAYAVALAVAGRANDALFAGLEALASARESGEPYGEKACARFLARLSRGAGHPEAAVIWEQNREKS